MFLGHFALALAAKKAAPQTSLGTTILAANLADEAWPLLLLLGVEHVRIVPGLMAACPFDFVDYPWSHSLAMGLLVGVVVGALYFALRKYAVGALVTGALVVSHWLLDLPFHRADLPLWPLWPGSPKVGLGLWHSLPLTLVLEFGVFAAGALVYMRVTRARDRIGAIALWSFLIFMVVAYAAVMFGPPPASATAGAWSALSGWILVPWGYFIDRHRQPVTHADRS